MVRRSPVNHSFLITYDFATIIIGSFTTGLFAYIPANLGVIVGSDLIITCGSLVDPKFADGY